MQEEVGKFHAKNYFLSQESLPPKGILKANQKGFSKYPKSKLISSQVIEMQKTHKFDDNFANS